MIIKYYSSLQALLCLITTMLLFWVTMPFILAKSDIRPAMVVEKETRLKLEAEAKIKEEPPIRMGSAVQSPKPVALPTVRVEKAWDDHLATIAHGLEALSPISSIFVSIWLWRKKRKEDVSPG